MHIFIYPPRYRYTAGLGNLLQSGGDVDAVAQNVLAINDDITEVDANPEDDAPSFICAFVAFGHAFLHFDHALRGFYDRREFQQQTIAHGFDDTPAVFSNFTVDQFSPMRPQIT